MSKQGQKLLLDGSKMIHHLDRVVAWQNKEVIYPIYLAFSPTSLCNHACTFCVYHYKKFEPIFFPMESYRKLIEEWSKLGIRSMFFAGDGEPLLHKNIVEMIELAKERNIDVAMNTNARLLTLDRAKVFADKLTWIRISLNAGTRDTYAKVHQTNPKDFDIVLKNIENLVDIKKSQNSDITIGIQCVLLNENAREIEELAKKLRDIGVDYLAVKPFIKHPLTSWEMDLDNKETIIEELIQLKELSTSSFKFALRENNFKDSSVRSYGKCLSSEFMIEVDARGDIYSCGPYIGDSRHRFGNILNHPFEVVWNSEECRERISYIRNKVDVSKCMPFCRPDAVNEFLWDLENPPQHVNFI